MLSPDFDYETALLACSRGNKRALQSIYELEGPRMLGIALHIVRQRQAAEDVLHDAFLNIWAKAGSFDATRGSGRGWIYSIVRNLALNAIRSGEREVHVSAEAMDDIESAESMRRAAQIPDAFELHNDLGRLHDCLSSLDAAKRNSILFAYVDGCSHAEISQRLDSPLGTVKAWIKRGLRALKECMT